MPPPENHRAWDQAATDMVTRLAADFHHGRTAWFGWQKTALSMANAWYIRSWQGLGKTRTPAPRPATWARAIPLLMREFQTQAVRQRPAAAWERWAGQRPPITRRCQRA